MCSQGWESGLRTKRKVSPKVWGVLVQAGSSAVQVGTVGILGVPPWGWGEPPEWGMPDCIPERCWHLRPCLRTLGSSAWLCRFLAGSLRSLVSLSLSFLIY